MFGAHTEKVRVSHLGYPRFHTNCEHVYCVLLSGLLPYKPVSHFNPCSHILNRATYVPHGIFAQNHLQIYLLRQDKWCTCARASEIGLWQSAKQTNCDKPQII